MIKINPFPVLITSRLLLRQIVPCDLQNIFKGLSHPKVIQYYGVQYKTLEETKEQMQFYKKLEETGEGIYWVVCSQDHKIFYGVGGMNNVNSVHLKAEIGFWLLPEYWGSGIMQEAMEVISNYAFKQVGLNRLEGFVETENEACKKALTKLGFQYEGTMNNCEIKNGKWICIDIYALLNRDLD